MGFYVHKKTHRYANMHIVASIVFWNKEVYSAVNIYTLCGVGLPHRYTVNRERQINKVLPKEH